MRRSLLWLLAVNLGFLVFVTPSKGAYYIVFVTAPLSILAGVWLANQLSRSGPRQAFATILIAALLSAQLVRTGARIADDGYHRDFLPVVSYLLRASQPADLIYASREFSTPLTPGRLMLDDHD
jgi:hypothetical protein